MADLSRFPPSPNKTLKSARVAASVAKFYSPLEMQPVADSASTEEEEPLLPMFPVRGS